MRARLTFFSLTLMLVGALNVTAVWADSSWPMTGRDPANTAFNSGEHTLNAHNVGHLRHAWTYSHQLSGLVVAGPRAYGVSPKGISVINAKTGKRMHLFTSKKLGVMLGLMVSGLAYAEGVLVFVTSQVVAAMNPSSGRLLWQRAVHFTTNLSISGKVVFTGSYCFNGCPTYALDLRSGKELWQNPTGGLINSVVSGRVYEGLLWQGHCQDRIFDAKTGTLISTVIACGSWTGDAAHTYGLVFPSDVKKSATLGPVGQNGKPAGWSVQVGRPDSTSLVYAYGTLFAATAKAHDGIVAVKAASGKVLWRRAVRGSFHLLAANHLLFVLHRSGAWVDVLSTANGKRVTRFRMWGAAKHSTLFGGLVADGELFASVGNDTVVMRP